MPRRMLYSIGFFLSFIITVLFVLHFPDRATVQTAVYRFCPHGNLTPPRISPSCPPCLGRLKIFLSLNARTVAEQEYHCTPAYIVADPL